MKNQTNRWMKMLLEDRNAVIYGAGGAIGGGLARTFAREGARVFLAGRTRESLEAVAADIRATGGSAEVIVVRPSTSGPSTSTPVRWPPRQAASTCPSTSSRAGTCRGSRWPT